MKEGPISNIHEIKPDTLFVKYEDWHPTGNDLWKRLEVPGDPRNGTYTSEEFDKKEQWNTDSTYLVSHRQRLEHWKETLGVTFAVEHYLNKNVLSSPFPRILEIGSWPMYNPIVERCHENTIIALLSQNKNTKVVGLDTVDPHPLYTPHFGESTYICGDFHDDKTKEKIKKTLGGNPNVIVGNMVFENDLYKFINAETIRKERDIMRKSTFLPIQVLTGYVPKLPDEDKYKIAENLSVAANSFLELNGILVICNGNSDTDKNIPEFVHKMPLLAVYLDETNKYAAVQIRGKLV